MTEALEPRRLLAADFPFIFGGGGFDNAQKTVQTRNGDLIVTGLFSGTANFAAAGQRGAFLTAQGDTDIFVADYAADGTLKWAIRIGGEYSDTILRDFDERDVQLNQSRFSRYVGRVGAQPREAGEYAKDIAVDADGNIFLAGSFRETIRAGRFRLTADQTFTADYHDALVMKIDPTGHVNWAHQFGGAFDDVAMSLGVDRTGSPTVGGYYSRQVDFDPSRATQVLETEGRDAGFVLRLTTDGDFGWVYQVESDAIGTDERNAVNDIAVTRRGEVYFAGSFAAEADFAPGREDELLLEADDKTDAFVAKLSRRGGIEWARRTGGDNYDANSAIALDADGNVYTAGYFSDEADIDPREDVETIVEATPRDPDDSSPTFSDLLITKLTPDGEPVWINPLGGGQIEAVADLTIGMDGSVYTTGSFFDQVDLAPGRAEFLLDSTRVNGDSIKDDNARFGRNESYDFFVSRLSPRGKFVSAARFGGADDDYAAGLTPLADGTLLLSGRIVSATPPDRDDRQEQGVIEQLAADLSIL